MQEDNGRIKNRRTSANRENRGNSESQHRGCCFWKKRARLDDTEQVSSNCRAKGPGKSTSDQFIYRRPKRNSNRCVGNAKDSGWTSTPLLSKNDPVIIRSCYAARNGCQRSSSFTHARISTKRRTLKQGFILENNVGEVHAFRWDIMGRFEKGDEKVHKSGSFSEVREVTYRGKRLVFKRVRKNYRLARREFMAWNLLSKNRYTKAITAMLFDSFAFGDYYYFISYAYETDFFYFLKSPHDIKIIFNILLQITNAVVILHNYNLAHLDIKPENILIRGFYAVLGDFATVYHVEGEKKIQKQQGTYEYCAPEMKDCIISTKSDVYSLTKTIFVALQGRFPNVDLIDHRYEQELRDLYLAGLEEKPSSRCNSVELYKRLYFYSLKYD
ncbi:MAG: hypothetical protein CMO44_18455 [Verrucomicrobiales bacterium]|nr:hypothetical protein [Verrucomicrobiales bacterium]